MRVSNLTIDMKEVCFKGNTLDVGNDNYGIIYNILKSTEDEVSVDYYVENIENGNMDLYDNGVLFFSLSQVSSRNERDEIIKEIWKNLRFGGTIYIWDREKKSKELVNDNIKVLMPDGNDREFKFSNLSPLSEFGFFNFQKTLEKYFEIQEGRICDRIIYIKAIKRGSVKDENTINSSKLKVHPQQFGCEVLKSIYKGLKFPRRD